MNTVHTGRLEITYERDTGKLEMGRTFFRSVGKLF